MLTNAHLLVALTMLAACQRAVPATSAHTAPLVAQSCAPLSPAMSLLTTPFSADARGEAERIEVLFARARELIGSDPLTGEQLFIVMVKEDPRFPQEAVYIMQTPPSPKPRGYRVVHAKATEQIQFQSHSILARITEAPLDDAVARSLEASWGAMALGARWPDRKGSIERMIWRGTQYTFDYSGDNVYGQGDTISPEPGTCAAALVDIGELLTRFADEPDAVKRNAIRAELLRQSQALAQRLGTAHAATAK